ncbi:hypothetical protein Ddc_10330 [Ditylenchus destructor]|nr:hypothetical protein Ddc_10330 [Ditylenchus destructor]
MQLLNSQFYLTIILFQALTCFSTKSALSEYFYHSALGTSVKGVEQNFATNSIRYSYGGEKTIRKSRMSSYESTGNGHTNSSGTDSYEMRQCVRAYGDLIFSHCRYPGMAEPCFREIELEKGSVLGEISGITSPNLTEKIVILNTVRKCCQGTCTLAHLEKLCCRTSDCLRQCYGKELAVGQDSPKYFDVLSQRHPKNRRMGRFT